VASPTFAENDRACPHTVRTDGVCVACGDCIHEIVLNGACLACGSTDIDRVARSPRPELVPADRLTRKTKEQP
jgi:hypothetical protein